MGDKLQAALDWSARGFRVFPLRPGSKKPLHKGWTESATSDPAAIAATWGNYPSANIGVLCDDLVVVDVDQKHGKNGLKSFLDLDLSLDTLIVKTPTGGRHVYYSGPNVSLSVGRLGSGLDIRSFHGYVVAPGSDLDPSDPDNEGVGGTYTIDQDAAVAPAEQSLLERLDRPRESRNASDIMVDLDRPDALVRAIEYLDTEAPVAVEGDGGDQLTLRVAFRVKDFGLSEAVAFDLLYTRWNDRCLPPWSPDELRTKVENAYYYGKSKPGVAHPSAEFAGVHVDMPQTAGRQWLHHGDSWSRNTSWLVYQTLPTTGVAILTAPSQAGKTFIALHLAACLAKGEAFFGTIPEDKGGAIVLAAEGGMGLGPRLAALGGEGRLPIAATQIGSLGVSGAVTALREDLRAKVADMKRVYGVPVRLIILDTLSASGILPKEEDNAMAAAVMKLFADISLELGALFLFLHHPPKTGTGERGASAIRNNADYVLEIFREGKATVRDLELTKGRDAEQRALGSFTLVPVDLGQDDRGRAITSMSVSAGGAKERRQGREPTMLKAFMESVELALGDDDAEGGKVHVEVVQSYFKDRSKIRDSGNRSKAFGKCLAWADDAGSIEVLLDGTDKFVKMKGFGV